MFRRCCCLLQSNIYINGWWGGDERTMSNGLQFKSEKRIRTHGNAHVFLLMHISTPNIEEKKYSPNFGPSHY